jgi:hypothetical protein
MVDSVDPREGPKKNPLATISLVLGALSVCFAQFCHAPGVFSILGCMGPILALAAVVTGVLGVARARRSGHGQKQAVGGLVTAAISIGLFLVKFVPVMLTPGGVIAQLEARPTAVGTPRPTLTPTPMPTSTATPPPTPTPGPVTHRAEGFTVTFTDDWEVLRSGSDSGTEFLIIHHPQKRIDLHVYRQTLSRSPDLETDTAAFISRNFGSPTMSEEGEIEIDGRRGLTKRFDGQTTTGQHHILVASVADGNDLYTFLVLSPSEEAFELHKDEIMQIIASTEILGAEPTRLPTVTPAAEPRTFSSDTISLTYPGNWVQIEATSDECQEPGATCFGILHPDEDGPALILFGTTHSEPPDLEALDQEFWGAIADDADLVTREEMVVGGENAIKRVFSVPGLDDPSDRVYMLTVVVAHENQSYEIIANASDAEDMMRYQATFEDIIASIEFAE